ncbi:MAG: hypothetical protein IKR13_01060 [Victivallales bacterium]|nr:hypothetical protein [Victivallales bacterium]
MNKHNQFGWALHDWDGNLFADDSIPPEPAQQFFGPKPEPVAVNIHAIADAFCAAHVICFVLTMGCWFFWEGVRWLAKSEAAMLKMLLDELKPQAEKYGLAASLKLTAYTLQGILRLIKVKVTRETLPPMNPDLIPCQNAQLLWNNQVQDFQIVAPTPENYVTNTLAVSYDPKAKCPMFMKVIERILPCLDDRKVVQMYFGAALFLISYTRKMLVFVGEGSSGKSLLVLLLSKILGRARVFDLRFEQLKETFALAALTRDTSLLSASEAIAKTLCGRGGEWAKRLVGGDEFAAQQKFKNENLEYAGRYSVIIVSNNKLRLEFESNGQEWRDRILLIFFRTSIPEAEQDKELLDKLYAEEGPGILNWLLEGARMVRRANWQIELTPAQRLERDSLIAFSGPVKTFVAEFVVQEPGDCFLSEDAYALYNQLVPKCNLPFLTAQKFYRDLAKAMSERFGATVTQNLRGPGGKGARGYHGFTLKPMNE